MKILSSLSTLLLTAQGSTGGSKVKFPNPLGFGPNYKFDFSETATESSSGWSLNSRCGQLATAGSSLDQRKDPSCPNVLLINTDDMAWGDVSINNPSKLVPTPNIDRLVSKGINFRDGHACTARCAPSRYCLMTGRYHFRRGDYHYKPMMLEYGRKILPQLFKRNNYRTMVVGKPQPVEERLDKDHFFVEGTRFWGYDQSYTSRSYCCKPGGGYFENDRPIAPFNRWSIFTEFRDEDEKSLWVKDGDVEKEFYDRRENWHFLDGYYVGGNPNGERVKNTYKAYWTAIDNNIPSGLNSRRRRDASGRLIRRLTRHNRRRRSEKEHLINEVLPPRKGGKQNYVRFMEKTTGKVIVASYRLKGMAKHISIDDRSNYEFAVNKTVYETRAEAVEAKKAALAELEANGIGKKSAIWTDMNSSEPKLTQEGYDSKEIMHRFHSVAIDYISDHVHESNPITTEGEAKTGNQPFFLYLSFRAPHRPNSHNLTFDPANPTEHLPHASIGKPGEQFSLFDEYIGNVMKTLHSLKVADNTLIFFTSDNGPDQGAFNMANRYGHMRMTGMRGKKASVYEGGHRVPFLSWWPLGTHRSNWGTNYDLPVGQVDLFGTFADIMNYPLPGGDKCIYSFNSDNAHSAQAGHDPASIGRPMKKKNESNKNYCKRVQEGIAAGNGTYSGEYTGYDTSVQLRMTKDNSADYLLESQDLGYENVEEWRTKEEKTGFLLGWDGCMAEDSQSFASAFNARKVGSYTNANEEEVHKFVNSQDKVPSKIFAGKLGDLSLRLGRYKLVRFNPPKDFRTGPSRQHLIDHSGPLWTKSEAEETGTECRYDSDGNKLNPDCEVEKYCREHTTFGHSNCMRDHYYQLWDLELNFGEKTLCSDSAPSKLNPNHALENAILGAVQPRKFNTGAAEKSGEKPTDRYGFGVGVESTPHGTYLNDCCVLNLDERNGFLSAIARTVQKERKVKNLLPTYNCGHMRVKKFGVEQRKGGGICKPNSAFQRQAGSTWESKQQFFSKVENRFLNKPFHYGRDYNWTSATHFNWPAEGEWMNGMTCTLAKTGYPDRTNGAEGHQIFDETLNQWRTITIADRLCWNGKDGTPLEGAETTAAPPGTHTTVDPTTLQPITIDQDFTLGCKVPDHNGPLAEGWQANGKWKADGLAGRHKPNVPDGQIDPTDFGKWFDFANCMKNAMQILEGQAYFPEVRVDKQVMRVGYTAQSYPELKPHRDDGSATGEEQSDDNVLAGRPIGSSNFAQRYIKELFGAVKNQTESGNVRFHGGGSRFIESQDGSDSLVGRCAKFLPNNVNDPYVIKPNYDIEMDLLGWYNSNDESGGGSHQDVRELIVERYENGAPVYRDDRPVHRYYKPDNNGAYLYKFDPQYHPSY